MISKDDVLIRIIDDEGDVREALKLMLDIEGWNCKVYENATSFLIEDNRHTPGCVLLDVRMPHVSGPELQLKMIERGIDLPIIFITGHADIDVAISTLKKGAVDFLLKPVDDQQLMNAIENAVLIDAKKRSGISGENRVRDGLSKLTDREKNTLSLFLKDLGDREVANYFGISERTVQGHRAKIYAKFGIHTARELQLLMPEIRSLMATGR